MALLEINALEKHFRTPEGNLQNVLNIDSFSLDAEEQMALKGQSGSGKTTFLHLIAGIISPDSGTILLDGHPLHALSESHRDRLRACTIGYIFQTFTLLQGFTCLENVCLGMMFGSGLDKKKAAALLGEVGLGNYLQHRPSQLSVGQQQRVAIARALANQPKLVLADEPTGNLDPELAQDAMQLIRRLCDESGAALLLVSHDTELLGQFEHCRDLKDINIPQKVTEA